MRPEADSAFIARMRVKMDEIRRKEHRPTVALVLSGGGAKGAAEAGALQYLEEQNIPVDMICGTSIGGLLSALYAVGYTSADMRELFCTQDWGITLTDKINPKYIPYEKKMRGQRYLVNIPFHYEKKEFDKRAQEVHRSPNFSADEEVNGVSLTNNFTSSLPTGYAYGFNINNLFSSLTVGYQDSISFTELPTPYMCVATDMVSCKANNWTSGSLNTAMRSTMSIPGLFEPVRTDGMILVDGGTRNNYPADVARACGADYIIGIELANAEPGYAGVSHLGNLLSQFIRMLGKDAYDENITYPDVRVRPDLKGFGMLSFNEEAVDTMMLRGYETIKSQSEQIALIKSAVGATKPRAIRKAVNIAKTPVRIGGIEFEGLDDRESVMLMHKIDLVAGQMVDKKTMDEAMSKLQATGAFESVSYSLYGESEPYRLVFHCVEGPTNVISLGLRIDQEEWAAIMLDLGINRYKLRGSKFDFSARVGRTQKLLARYSLDFPAFPTLNADIGYNHSMYDVLARTEDAKAQDTWEHRYLYSRIFLSKMAWTRFAFQAGVQYRQFMINTNRFSGKVIEATFPDEANAGYSGLFINTKLYTLDDMYYPSKGVHLIVGADADIAKNKNPNFNPITALYADFKFIIPMGSVVSLIPDLHWRSVIASQNSYFHMNFAGGTIAGRYIDQQIPLVGVLKMTEMYDNIFVANLDLRFKLPNAFYISAKAGYANSSEVFSEMFTDLKPEHYGFELQGGYDSIAGPLKLSVMWSDLSRWSVGLSLGFDF